MKSTEELIVRKIESGIQSVKHGTTKPEDAQVFYFLNKLNKINDGLYEDLAQKYYDTLDAIKSKNNR